MDNRAATVKRIITFDPGNNLGVSCMDVDLKTKQIYVNDAHTIDLNKIAEKHYVEMMEFHGMSITRILIIEDIIKAYGECWVPDFGMHETAFSAHNHRNLKASVESFAKLRENILGIRLGLLAYRRDMKIIAINPNTVKYCVLGQKNNDKDQIKEALTKLKNLDSSKINLEQLDQHAIDSIAIGYTGAMKVLMG